MVPGAKWRSHNNALAGCNKLSLVMAGFLTDDENGSSVLVKPDTAKSVPLRLRKKGDGGGGAAATKPVAAAVATINGVGFVDYGDDFSEDEEMIDEDTLVDEDLQAPVQQRLFPSPR